MRLPRPARSPSGRPGAPAAGPAAALIVVLAATACAVRQPPPRPVPAPLPLSPIPATLRVAPGDSFTVDTTASIGVVSGDDQAIRVARLLSEIVGTTPESRPVIRPPTDPGAASAAIVLAVDPATDDLHGTEGYRLRVSDAGVRIDAAHAAGLFYGVQTLRQLLPPAVEFGAARPAPRAVPMVEIEDRPRYAWRGAMLDVARHFFEPADVMRYIDLLALHKINRLHLHLADDQGWRIEVPAYPRLTEHGASTEVGGGPGGFYTVDDYREIVRYAADRFITIVPEIDMPGHTNAALASVPELNCDSVAPPLYTGIEVGFSALCVDRDETWEFVDAVIGHLAELTPGPWFHMGGDEVEKLTEEEYAHFVDRVEAIVHRHGRTMVGWAEIVAADIDDSTLLQHWWGEGADLGDAADGQVILSPASRLYVDMKYDAHTPIGLDWAGITPLREAYDWEPTRAVLGLPPAAIAGIEAPLWTETVDDIRDLELLAFPRIAAAAEVAWSPAQSRDWDDFRRRIALIGLRWTALGVNFHRSPDVDWIGF